VHVDGRLEEAAWVAAPAFSAFVESFPRPGAAASFRTEVRPPTRSRGTLRSAEDAPGTSLRELRRYQDFEPWHEFAHVRLEEFHPELVAPMLTVPFMCVVAVTPVVA
jgi:hypothetical protein